MNKGDFVAVCEQRNEAQAEAKRLRTALEVPLQETILAVLRHMPSEAAPEHLAAQIEAQVRAWQARHA